MKQLIKVVEQWVVDTTKEADELINEFEEKKTKNDYVSTLTQERKTKNESWVVVELIKEY